MLRIAWKGAPAPSAIRRYVPLALLAAVFALGLGIRLHYAPAVRVIPRYSDMAYYNRLALEPGVPSEAPPGYPLFLRLIYAIWGTRNYTAVYIVQSALSALTILLVYLITRKVSSARAALLAAGIAAIYPNFIAYCFTTMTETVSVLIVALLLAALTIPSSDRARAILAAVVLTAGFLFKPVLLLFAPGVLLSVKRRILFLVALVLILGPFLSYDLIAGKDVLRGARGFYLTYNPATTVTHRSMNGTELRRNDLPAGTYFDNALAFMRTNKMRVVDIIYNKASILLSRGRDQSVFRPFVAQNPNAYTLLLYGHIPVMILGAVGMARYLDPNTRRVAFPALSYLILVILASIFKTRYRLPAELAMIVFAGITLAHATSRPLPRLRLPRPAGFAGPPEPENPRSARTESGPRLAGAFRWKRLIAKPARRAWDIPCLLLLVSLALRFYLASVVEAPIRDAEPRAASEFVEMGHFGADVAPLYPLFLRGIYAVFGTANYRAVFAVQAVIVAAAMMLLYGAVSAVAGRRAGIVAGVLGIVFPNMLLAHLRLSPVSFILLCTAALMAIAASRYPSSLKAAISGLLVGFGILLAPAFAYIVPGALAVQRRWLFLLVLVGTLLPYTVFNALQRPGRLVPVYLPSLYEVRVSDLFHRATAWDGIGRVYENGAMTLSKQWHLSRVGERDSSTELGTFAAGYGFVAILYLGLIGLVRCWKSEHRNVFLPPLLYTALLIVVSRLGYQDRAVFEVVLAAYAAMLLAGSCGDRSRRDESRPE